MKCPLLLSNFSGNWDLSTYFTNSTVLNFTKMHLAVSHIHNTHTQKKINRRIFACFLCERAKSTSSSLCLRSDPCLVIYNTRNMEHTQL